MAQITFSSLKLKTPTEVNTFDFMGKTIEVDTYMPVNDKLDIMAIAMQKAEENGIYNPMLLDIFFHLNLVYMYCNITFTDKQKEDELKIFDLLQSNGFFDLFLPFIEEDYAEMRECLDSMTEDIIHYNNSAGHIVQNLIQDLPQNAEAAKMIVDSFDPEKYGAVINFAKAANGGRGIPENVGE